MEFKHPKYYAALRAERRKQQATSVRVKHQAVQETSSKRLIPDAEDQASSHKHQAP